MAFNCSCTTCQFLFKVSVICFRASSISANLLLTMKNFASLSVFIFDTWSTRIVVTVPKCSMFAAFSFAWSWHEPKIPVSPQLADPPTIIPDPKSPIPAIARAPTWAPLLFLDGRLSSFLRNVAVSFLIRSTSVCDFFTSFSTFLSRPTDPYNHDPQNHIETTQYASVFCYKCGYPNPCGVLNSYLLVARGS